jgi:glycosyltransferase involved in cell wall biosynthesis
MRILHVIHQYFPDHVGGTEHYARSLALSQRKLGHRVAIFCRRSGVAQDRHLERETSEHIQVYRAVSGPFTPAGRFRSTLHDPFLADALANAVLEIQPDLIHIHHLMGLPASAIWATGPAAPLVVTLHDYWWVCANAQLITDYHRQVCDGPRWWLNCARCGLARAGAGVAWPLSPIVAPLFAWRATILRRLMRYVSAWIAPTAFVGNWHTTHGFPAERMHVIGHGMELPSLEVWPAARGNGQTASHFAYIGGLSQQKGIHVLIDAFNGLGPSARLTIAGDETAFPGYCTELRARATHPGIQFVGQLDRRDVWQTLASADVLVVPSLWYETASLVVQEAFATGTPVIAADHGALAERVDHEVDGLLVPPGDALALRRAMGRLVDEPGLMTRLCSGIKPGATLAEHVQQVERVYQQVLA